MAAPKCHCPVLPQMSSPASVQGALPRASEIQENPGMWVGQTERARAHLAPRFTGGT